MSKRKLLPAALLFLGTVIVALSACNKDNITLNNGTNEYTLNYLFGSLKSTPQTFTVTAGTNQRIEGAKGTLLTFHPQSFRDANGNTISSGTVNIELIETYKPGTMIANRVTTSTASNRQQTSGGSVHIKATMNGQEVFANNYSIGFKQSGPSENPMALFRGYAVTDSSASDIKWADDTTGTVDRTTKVDSSESFYYLFDSCTSFNWINCDYFYSAPAPKTDITVVMPDSSYNATNTQVFVVFPAINSVTTMYAYDAATHSIKFGYSNYYLPVGSQVHIIVIGAKNNNYFTVLQQNVTVTNNMTISLTPVAQPLSYIQSLLSSL